MAHVRANDFAAQWAELRDDALAAVDRVGRSGWLVLGEEVEAFERELAAWWGIEHAVGVASGLDAIEIALRCAGIGPGDRVLTTPLTAFATTLAVLRAGAEPVFATSTSRRRWTSRWRTPRSPPTRHPRAAARAPVRPAARPAALAALAEPRVELIEDCAQSARAPSATAPTGSIGGLAAATSLYPTKNLGAMGDGGVRAHRRRRARRAARSLRNYGQRERYLHVELGLNSRLDELQAADPARRHLPRLDGWLARRARDRRALHEALAGPRLRPIAPSGGRSAQHLFPVEVVGGRPGAARRAPARRGRAASAATTRGSARSSRPPPAGVDGRRAAGRPAARRARAVTAPASRSSPTPRSTRVIAACRELAA